MSAAVEFIPLGVSLIERDGKEFVDEQHGGDVIRRWREYPSAAEVVSWKHEGSSGPVYIDGTPMSEVDFDGSGSWSTGWYTKAHARKIAKHLGAQFAEA